MAPNLEHVSLASSLAREIPVLRPLEPLFRSRRIEARTHLGYLTGSHCFLDIWDFKPSAEKLEEPKLVCRVRDRSELPVALESLPEPAPGAIRIYIDEMYADGIFNSHIEKVYGVKANRPATSGFQALAAQCNGTSAENWTQTQGYGFLQVDADAEGSKDDPWASSIEGSGQCQKSSEQDFLHSFFSPIDKWAETIRRLHLNETGGHKFVIISCATFVTTTACHVLRKERNPFVMSEQLSSRLCHLINTYQTRTLSSVTWKQFVLLQVYHASLDLFVDYLASLKQVYVAPQAKDFDARSVKLREWNLRELTRDAYFYQNLTDTGHSITSQTEYLLDLTSICNRGEILSAGDTAILRTAELELRGRIRDAHAQLSSFSNHLKLHIDFLRLARDTSQTSSVKNLTILATIFLPMGLATGILSMTKRFNELDGILYDFFGVLMLVLIFVAIFFVVVTLLSFLISSAGIQRSQLNKIGPGRVKLYFILLSAVAGLLVLAAFLVGMFVDIVLGVKIMGYGLAALLGALLLIVIVRPIYKTRTKKKQTPSDSVE